MLQHIVSLKQLGFALEEIRAMVSNPAFDAVEMLKLHLSRLNEQINAIGNLRDRVQDICDQLQLGQSLSSELVLTVIQMTNMMQSPHFKPEQIVGLRNQYFSWGADERNQFFSNGQQLLAQFRKCLELGRAPSDPAVMALAHRWKDAMAALPADAQFIKSAESYYQENPDAALSFGMDGELYRFITKAIALL